MSFNLGNNDRTPAFGSKPPGAGRNPLSEAIHSAERNQGGDMILTKDHPGWSGRGGEADIPSGGGNAHAQPSASSSTSGAPADLPQRPPAAVHSGAASGGGYDRRPDSELPTGAVPRGARFDQILPGEVRPPNFRGDNPTTGNNNIQLSGEPDQDDMLPPGMA